MHTEIRPCRSEELEITWALDHQVFNTPPRSRDFWCACVDPARIQALFVEGRLAAMAYAWPFGQYFGGRSVPMAGIAGVAVAPEYRGRGFASKVLDATIPLLRERGEVISCLYPATTSLYRGLGWEVAGAHAIRRIPAAALRQLERPEAGRVRRAQPEDLPAMKACYAAVAPSTNGFLERDASRWWDLQERFAERYAYVAVASSGVIEGYVVYRHDPVPPGSGGDYAIRVEECIATDRPAWSGLWWTVGSSSSVVESVIYAGPPEDPLLLLLPEQPLSTQGEIRWMLRVVDAAGAIERRGFPRGLDVRVELALEDARVPENSGNFVLSVTKGEGRLEAGGAGAVQLGIGAFSALYTGWASTDTLQRARLLNAASSDQRAGLDAAFAGPTPWMADTF